ncbi:oxidoreductase, partial [Streptomyces sp. ME03-5684b]|nr:oxidoreductase [Streptomyces sp. ME03-5684b]
YDTTLRPFTDEIQGEVNPRLLKLAMPMTQRAIDTFLTVTGMATRLRVPDLATRFSKEDRGGAWRLPHYPEPRAA